MSVASFTSSLSDIDKPTAMSLALLGESTVGKSSLVLQLVNGIYGENLDPTAGAVYYGHEFRVNDKSVKLKIWDTAGQERFNPIIPMYYRYADAVIIVYDITKSVTFDKAKLWIDTVQNQTERDPVIALVGNKFDLTNDDDKSGRQVHKEDAKAYAKEMDIIFFETSAKSNHNVGTVFKAIAEKTLLKFAITDEYLHSQSSNRVILSKSSFHKNESCAC